MLTGILRRVVHVNNQGDVITLFGRGLQHGAIDFLQILLTTEAKQLVGTRPGHGDGDKVGLLGVGSAGAERNSVEVNEHGFQTVLSFAVITDINMSVIRNCNHLSLLSGGGEAKHTC